jgi:hypothetical protein
VEVAAVSSALHSTLAKGDQTAIRRSKANQRRQQNR